MATEQRLVDANEAYEIARSSGRHDDFGRCMADLTSLKELLEDCTTVDAVEVVRCRECRHSSINENHPNKPLICYMTKKCGTTAPDWFCADGERRK